MMISVSDPPLIQFIDSPADAPASDRVFVAWIDEVEKVATRGLTAAV
jgi:hypothetical protein